MGPDVCRAWYEPRHIILTSKERGPQLDRRKPLRPSHLHSSKRLAHVPVSTQLCHNTAEAILARSLPCLSVPICTMSGHSHSLRNSDDPARNEIEFTSPRSLTLSRVRGEFSKQGSSYSSHPSHVSARSSHTSTSKPELRTLGTLTTYTKVHLDVASCGDWWGCQGIFDSAHLVHGHGFCGEELPFSWAPAPGAD